MGSPQAHLVPSVWPRFHSDHSQLKPGVYRGRPTRSSARILLELLSIPHKIPDAYLPLSVCSRTSTLCFTIFENSLYHSISPTILLMPTFQHFNLLWVTCIFLQHTDAPTDTHSHHKLATHIQTHACTHRHRTWISWLTKVCIVIVHAKTLHRTKAYSLHWTTTPLNQPNVYRPSAALKYQ